MIVFLVTKINKKYSFSFF